MAEVTIIMKRRPKFLIKRGPFAMGDGQYCTWTFAEIIEDRRREHPACRPTSKTKARRDRFGPNRHRHKPFEIKRAGYGPWLRSWRFFNGPCGGTDWRLQGITWTILLDMRRPERVRREKRRQGMFQSLMAAGVDVMDAMLAIHDVEHGEGLLVLPGGKTTIPR